MTCAAQRAGREPKVVCVWGGGTGISPPCHLCVVLSVVLCDVTPALNGTIERDVDRVRNMPLVIIPRWPDVDHRVPALLVHFQLLWGDASDVALTQDLLHLLPCAGARGRFALHVEVVPTASLFRFTNNSGGAPPRLGSAAEAAAACRRSGWGPRPDGTYAA